MDLAEVFANFSDPQKIKDLPAMALLWGGLVTTLLGMGITFVALYLLQLLIGLFEKIGGAEEVQPAATKKKVAEAIAKPAVRPASQSDGELVAAITAALALMLETSASGIVIRGIRRIEDATPAWGRAGIAEQMQNRMLVSWGMQR